MKIDKGFIYIKVSTLVFMVLIALVTFGADGFSHDWLPVFILLYSFAFYLLGHLTGKHTL